MFSLLIRTVLYDFKSIADSHEKEGWYSILFGVQRHALIYKSIWKWRIPLFFRVEISSLFGLSMMSSSTVIWKSWHLIEHGFPFHYSIWAVNILLAPLCHDSKHFYCLVVLHLYLNMSIFLDTGKSNIEMLFVLLVHALNFHICA